MNIQIAQQAVDDAISALLRAQSALQPNVLVTTSADLQPALNAAMPGDTIELALGSYRGAFVLPPKDGPVKLTTRGSLPDRRVGPNDFMALLSPDGPVPVINGTNAANWVLDGIAFESRQDGAGEVILLQDATNILLSRIVLVADDNGQKRAIRGNGKNITLTRSYIANIWASGADSQAFCAWDGAGPYTLTDNYLEAASENVMFGGADSKSADKVPSDILIEGNFFTKRLEWKPVPPARTSGKVVKNLLELKAAKRVIIRGNTFERSWADAQTGYGISFKSVNQGGKAPWSATEDVLFENNTVRDVENGFNIQGRAADQPGGRTTGIVIRGNTVQTSGVAMQITGAPGTITIDRSTFVNGYTFLQLDGDPMESLTVTNTLANHNAYGVKGGGTAIGTPSLTKFAKAWTWTNNVLVGGAGKGVYPPTTWFDLASVPAGVQVGR